MLCYRECSTSLLTLFSLIHCEWLLCANCLHALSLSPLLFPLPPSLPSFPPCSPSCCASSLRRRRMWQHSRTTKNRQPPHLQWRRSLHQHTPGVPPCLMHCGTSNLFVVTLAGSTSEGCACSPAPHPACPTH